MQPLSNTDMIIHPDGSIYHLKLKPGEVAETIVTVGDPDRVQAISKYFDAIEFERQHREFRSCTGTLGKKRLTIVSTGIGTDNIDIVVNELDALVNIDFESRLPKSVHTRLTFIRLGTSGSIINGLDVDSLLFTDTALGTGDLGVHYRQEVWKNDIMRFKLAQKLGVPIQMVYGCRADAELAHAFESKFIKGNTFTASGFYRAQGRKMRPDSTTDQWLKSLCVFRHGNFKLSNIEMETAGLYQIATALGHRAISLSAILANRRTGKFSSHPDKIVDKMVRSTLSVIKAM